MTPLRLGVLGCGAVAGYAILQPARDDGAVTVAAVASRDAAKARAYAAEHGIPRSYGSYAALLADRDLDAIYVALPNALHGQWSIAALRRGLPVLCEKPIAANAAEAAEMANVADAAALPLVEAFHWRAHPAATRLRDLVRSGVLGAVRRIEVNLDVPAAWIEATNIRLDAALGGGSMMDQGCYCVSFARWLGAGEPRVVTAHAALIGPELDGAMQATLRFADGSEAHVGCSMNKPIGSVECGARILGEHGSLQITNPFFPGMGSQLTLTRHTGETEIEQMLTVPTYTFQARAFAALVRSGDPARSLAQDAVAGMTVIDAIYRAAGLRVRQSA